MYFFRQMDWWLHANGVGLNVQMVYSKCSISGTTESARKKKTLPRDGSNPGHPKSPPNTNCHQNDHRIIMTYHDPCSNISEPKKKITSSGISPEVATKNRVCSLCFHHPSASILPSSPQEMPPPPRKPDLDRQGDCRKKPDLATSEHYAAKDPIGRT
jgi:hypothetical protein